MWALLSLLTQSSAIAERSQSEAKPPAAESKRHRDRWHVTALPGKRMRSCSPQLQDRRAGQRPNARLQLLKSTRRTDSP